MKSRTSIVLLLVVLTCACDAGRRATFDKELEICLAAQRLGDLVTAEPACARALAVAESSDFDPALRSQTLYTLGRIKRQLAKFAEAEQLQRQALLLEEQRDSPDVMEIGRRLIEISINLAGQNRWTDGAQVLERVMPMADALTGKARSDAANVFRQYARRLAGSGQTGLAERFASQAAALQAPARGVESVPSAGQGQKS